MLICCCSLAGTKACLSCPNYINAFGGHIQNEGSGFNKKVTEYYEDGKLVKRVIEDMGTTNYRIPYTTVWTGMYSVSDNVLWSQNDTTKGPEG